MVSIASSSLFTHIWCSISAFITGGILFVVALYMTEDGQYDGASKGGRNLFQTMHTIWKQLYREGKITKVNSDCALFTYINSYPPTKWPPFHRKHIHMHFVNEKLCILIKISWKFVPKGPIHNKPVLVQVMAWRQTGGKPLPEVMLTQFTDAYMRHLGIWDARNSLETSLSQHGIKKNSLRDFVWREINKMLICQL